MNKFKIGNNIKQPVAGMSSLESNTSKFYNSYYDYIPKISLVWKLHNDFFDFYYFGILRQIRRKI